MDSELLKTENTFSFSLQGPAGFDYMIHESESIVYWLGTGISSWRYGQAAHNVNIEFEEESTKGINQVLFQSQPNF